MKKGTEMEAKWSAPANIAIIKYWGKRGLQLPANPSISMTLEKSRTTTRVIAQPAKKGGWSYTYEGQKKPAFEKKIGQFMSRVQEHLPFLGQHQVLIDSINNFPHSSGISSSASFYASLALCLLELEFHKKQIKTTPESFFEKASELARLGSGSASRSLYGHWVAWGETGVLPSKDQYAVPLTEPIHPVFQSYKDAVIIISSGTKALSSSAGHSLMDANPYSVVRYTEAHNNLKRLASALQSGDIESFIEITEHEALSLHGLIMISGGGTLLMNPGTVQGINRIRDFRKQTGSKCCFTLDAGPNIHLLYPEEETNLVHEFIARELTPIAENGRWIDDRIGEGPKNEGAYSDLFY